ncbi:hypothetical protein BGZ60DRAFT_470176 [Tricladium varicosporioides]|nr:hypothetical protein BGZ60DRAFT_470176 [Hymenoscyphus varicosporioides]
MNQYEKEIQDLFDGDPRIEIDYHQDYREGVYTSYGRVGFVLPLLLCIIPFIYQVFRILDYDLLPLPELLWNCIVYLTPSRLLDAVESYTSPLRITNPALKHIPRTHAAKSEAMRRILGLDRPGGILGSVAQASRRRLSTLPGINMTAQGTDRRPAGLGNWDNSCYQNSVLQGLASLDSLSGYLTNPTIEIPDVKGVEKPDMKMAEALKGLIGDLMDPENSGRKLWTPAALKNMSSWQQQDAQEYFSKVLDEIDKEVGKAATLMRKSQGLESTDSHSSSSKDPESSRSSIYRNPLEGLIAQRVGCTNCGYSEGLSMIPFNCLTVPLGRAWGYNVSNCLDEYTKLERIEGVECGKCTLLKSQKQLSTIMERAQDNEAMRNIYDQSQQRLEAVTEALEDDDYEDKTLLQKCKIPPKNRVSSTKTRQAVVARPPKSLVVHFNRSLFDELTGELRKNTSAVHFPKILDLGPWCLGSSGVGDEAQTEEWLLNPEMPMVAGSEQPSRLRGPLYELRAVVTHFGRHENGHYVCYRKHLPIIEDEDEVKHEQWWRLSDEEVTKVSEDTVLGQGGVFMLFYDCIERAIPMSDYLIPMDMPTTEKDVPAVVDAGQAIISSDEISKPLPPMPSTEFLDTGSLAANTPLPDLDDTDISLYSGDDTTLREESVATATSISEYDDDDVEDIADQEEYQPTKPIVVTPYVPQTGRKKSEASLKGSSGSLLMV